ncbi:threonine/serine exporter family protein [Sinanaerobacter chloroacetimidivorans]|uniref:Threonine/serine exporter family protein n=1 Tax=Sinanaerobacter chloroacetimidivorans TaxID=2818044 RepID=A0A8J7W1M7_9FIRM|nr:threonine/serine exporter family protein [Sinanaerobacter chloroacetimidivorans]MBR0599174.1 threonine/serine exporter family protein [Sinanaerobacter chloroacetimidivorans]
MINQVQKKVLILALHAGELMMKSGAEIYRVEDTITRICKACKIPYVEVFATPTGIFLSLDEGSPDSDMHTFIKRIRGSSIDLEKISRINHFSRVFTTTDLTIDEGLQILKGISGIKPYPFLFRIFGAALVASFFALIFEGNAFDFLSAFLIGAFSYTLSILLDRIEINLFIKGFSCCAIATFLALLLYSVGLGSNLGALIIGSIMIFLPGVAITNAVRDTLAGDMLAGVSKGMEAVMVAVSLAAGVGVALKIWDFFGGTFL